MSKFTLEDVALECTGDVYLDHDVRERAAALCRSAQAVIDRLTAELVDYREACEQKQEQIDSAKYVLKAITESCEQKQEQVDSLHALWTDQYAELQDARRLLAEARELIDGCFELVEISAMDRPSQKAWKESWLAKARKALAGDAGEGK